MSALAEGRKKNEKRQPIVENAGVKTGEVLKKRKEADFLLSFLLFLSLPPLNDHHGCGVDRRRNDEKNKNAQRATFHVLPVHALLRRLVQMQCERGGRMNKTCLNHHGAAGL